MLDFASGHGRFTRVLAAVYPKPQIWAAEILSDAVRFQRDVLGVNSFQSATTPEDLKCDRKSDLIYVGSLFTHLPDRTFARWLKKLFEMLTPEGILVFTTHGTEHLKQGVALPEFGIYYLPESEIPSLNTNDYGATVVSEHYVRRAIVEVTGKPDHLISSPCFGILARLVDRSSYSKAQARLSVRSGSARARRWVRWHSPVDLSFNAGQLASAAIMQCDEWRF